MRKKSVQAGIVKVSVIGLVLLVFCFGGYYIYEKIKIHEMKQTAATSFDTMSGKILRVNYEKYFQTVRDNSAWDELFEAVSTNNSDDINELVGYMLKSYSAENISVFDSEGKSVYSKSAPSSPDHLYPFEGDALKNLFNENCFASFFEQNSGRLLAYFAAGIVPTDDEYDRKSKPAGFLFLVKEITPDALKIIENQLGEATINVFYNQEEKDAYLKSCKDECVVKELKDFNQKPQAYFCLTFSNPLDAQANELLLVILIVGGEVLLILLNIFLFFKKRVTKPLNCIEKAFKQSNTTPIIPVTKSPDEFGDITQMMAEFFEQKEEILVQNEQVMQLNEELKVINDDLNSQRKRVEEQNRAISLTNKQLTDSISYASRLQSAMLLAHSPKQGWFADSCSFYFPKEIVGGDFYVAQTVGTKHIAVLGDCTGHGVPGAVLVSMGISFLYQIIDFKECELMPDYILTKLREKVISSFGVDKDGAMRSDGMDVAVVVYDTETKETFFSGAQRPAVIVKDNEVIEVKGDKMPIGRYVKEGEFTRIKLDVAPGDSIYLFSDGCTDQVGGEHKRKIMSKHFREKILEYSALPMKEQAERLTKYIFDYKGDCPQTDDIALIAFKL